MNSSMDTTDMRTDAQAIHVGAELALPWDLRNWFGADTLRQWIVEEIDTLDWHNPEAVDYLRQRPGFQPKAVLCLLTYAYATGVFESEEIDRRGHADADYLAIVGVGWRADARQLTRF